ncbi:unnamed protein product [Prorocentrum cordatum]|uniref:Beta-galactosidase n=1 Tax=Prorocentrum cordatum TaxID=2364126 RepID=A0ABN9XQC0_9DINO|nr:unnamed protein product [Polarella glacialis]
MDHPGASMSEWAVVGSREGVAAVLFGALKGLFSAALAALPLIASHEFAPDSPDVAALLVQTRGLQSWGGRLGHQGNLRLSLKVFRGVCRGSEFVCWGAFRTDGGPKFPDAVDLDTRFARKDGLRHLAGQQVQGHH